MIRFEMQAIYTIRCEEHGVLRRNCGVDHALRIAMGHSEEYPGCVIEDDIPSHIGKYTIMETKELNELLRKTRQLPAL